MSEEISAEEYRRLQKPRKYGNRKVEADGYRFDSQAEMRRYHELCLMLAGGLISDLDVHPKFPVVINGERAFTYTADFSYIDARYGSMVVEDVKSPATMTQVYRLKKKILAIARGIEITEVFS